jgi:hypothetical protein
MGTPKLTAPSLPAVLKSKAIDEFVELAHEIFNRVFRKVPENIERRDQHGEG